MASGHAIELALEIATLVKNENKTCIHQVISQRVHLTDIGESLHKRNELDQEQLQWMMKGKGVAGADQTSCVDRFQFIKN